MLTLGITLRRRVSTFRGGRRREAQQLADCVAPIVRDADALGVRRVSSAPGLQTPFLVHSRVKPESGGCS